MQAETALLQNLLNKATIEPGGKMGTAGTPSQCMKDAGGSGIGEKSFLSTLLGVAGNQEVGSSENMSLLESIKKESSEEGISLKDILAFLKQNNISIEDDKGQLNSIIKNLIVGVKDSGNNDIPGNPEQKLEGDLSNGTEGNLKQEQTILRLLSLIIGDNIDSNNTEKGANLNSLLNEKGFSKDSKLFSEIGLKESQGGNTKIVSEILKNSAESAQRNIPLEKGNLIINSELINKNNEDSSPKQVAEIQKDSSLFKLSRTETPLQAKVIQMNTAIEQQGIDKDSVQAKVLQTDGATAQKLINKDSSLSSVPGFKESAEGVQNTNKDLLKNMDILKKEGADSVAFNKNQNPIEKAAENSKLSSHVDTKISQMHTNPNGNKNAEENANSDRETTSTKSENNSDVKVSGKTTEGNLKNPVLIERSKLNSEAENQPRISETVNKELRALNKEISRLQDGKTSDSEKGETGRFNLSTGKEIPPIGTNADSWQKYVNIKDPAQKFQMSGENVNISKVVKIESGNGEDATLSSNNQSAEKNLESVPRSKETQHFQKTFQPAVMKQVVEKAMMNLTNGQSSIKISLKPEALGQLKMQITTENNQVMVKILTQVPMVKEIIESNLSQLKAGFQNQGLEIEKFDVSVDHGSTQHKAFSGRLPFPGAIDGAGDEGNEDGILDDTEQNRMRVDTRRSSGLVNFFA